MIGAVEQRDSLRETNGSSRGKNRPASIAGTYLLLATIWILGSDFLFSRLLDVPISVSAFQVSKGLGFVVVTAWALYFVVRRDFLSLQRQQRAARKEAAVYRLVLDASPEALIVADRRLRILLANANAARLLGEAPEDLHGKELTAFWKGRDAEAVVAYLSGIQKSKTAPDQPPPAPLQLEAGPIPIQMTARFARIANGRQPVLLVALTDLQVLVAEQQQRREEEARLHESQRMESLGMLAGQIAHDFNNIVGAVIGHAELAHEDLPPDSPAGESVREVLLAGRRASDLARQLLLYAGRGKMQEERINLTSVAEELSSLMKVAISRHVHVRRELAPELPSIRGDATQIRQILLNLLMNASQAIGTEQGTVALRTGAVTIEENSPNGDHYPEPPSAGRYVFLEVEDNGCGMPEDQAARIFEPFYTTRQTGTGLGLAAVLGIVRAHHGSIQVRTQVGEGTCFRLLFPVR